VRGYFVHLDESNDLQYESETDPEEALDELLDDLDTYDTIPVRVDGSDIVNAVENRSDGLEGVADAAYRKVRGEIMIEQPEEGLDKALQIEYIPEITNERFNVIFFKGHGEPWREKIRDALEELDVDKEYDYH